MTMMAMAVTLKMNIGCKLDLVEQKILLKNTDGIRFDEQYDMQNAE